jgi:hypothetical protein
MAIQQDGINLIGDDSGGPIPIQFVIHAGILGPPAARVQIGRMVAICQACATSMGRRTVDSAGYPLYAPDDQSLDNFLDILADLEAWFRANGA